MKLETIQEQSKRIAVISGDDVRITDLQSALDLIMTVRYETGADRIVLSKAAVSDAIFILSTGLAGEILQKFINYRVKLAIYGDYSGYTSKPLKDFIYESNKGTDVFFMDTKEQAVERLKAV